MFDAPPREIKTLRGLYIFQGVLLWIMTIYLFWIRSSSSASYSTGAGLGAQLLLTVFLFLFPLVFFQVARHISGGEYWGIGLVLSLVVACYCLLTGITELILLGWVHYSSGQGFIAVDLSHLAFVVCLLIFGITSLACMYYLLLPTVRTWLRTKGASEELHSYHATKNRS